ncbi:GH32 C-terminal domain-containing protein [uncultured Parabacteroides sp.]|jgi:sucrose-6-phosphate hydrolase SacC (GH32 family)|uniref:GH32 C-terminal domain-containing protein n=1 Tax=uncultured Parabacteroides sp. TaxID=512312 RepID=UPI0025E2E7B9|nr:GH32 C-terminal domain-containing protein [uncultured Parabacteroides sp.]
MNRLLTWGFIVMLLATSCRSESIFDDAVAVWSFSDLNDQAGENSMLKSHGEVPIVNLKGNKAAQFDGSAWLDAGQGAGNELNLTGKEVTLYTRVKASVVNGYSPVITKAGNDQNLAYSIALNPIDKDIYIEVKMGSDEIAGTHLLKHKLPEDEINGWQDILFRFNGKRSELYVNGILRDDEVTVGQIRDWNCRPLLIGAQYKQPDGYAEAAKNEVEATFKGLIDLVALWDKWLPDPEVMALSNVTILKDGRPEYYKEKYRPQFHFSAKKNWLNDPNGLVFYDGVYHLFFQYMPPHRPGAYKDWGHAISKDLVHWEQITDHITPHKVWSGCWSGSAVVDINNVVGFQTGDKKAIIAFITNGGHPDAGLGPLCTQCIAYSNDGGMTFTYYDQNPVIRHIKYANRDPKVVWDEESQQWIMSLFMDEGYEFALFGSEDLKEWKYLSTSSIEGVRECPGFEALPVDGDSDNKKWLFFGANGDYVIGSFNGKDFKAETKVLRGDYGTNYYAAQTWNNVSDGRCVTIAWMPTLKYPGMPFEQQMNFPTEITLRTTSTGFKAFRMPVREIQNLYDKEYTWENQTINGEEKLDKLNNDLYDMELELDVTRSSSFEIALRNVMLTYDAVKKTLSCGGTPMRNGIIPDNWVSGNKSEINDTNNLGRAFLPARDGKIRLRILLDRNSVEIFGNDGEVVMSSCFMPEDNNKTYAIRSQGELLVVKAKVYSLKSAWNI